MFTINNNNHLGYNLFKDFSSIHRYSQIFLLSKLKENKMMDCHPPVLLTIYFNEGLSQNELSKILDFNKGAIAKLVKTLVEGEYITKALDEKDKRAHKLYLTDKGKNVIPKLFDFESQWIEKVIKGITDDELKTLEGILGKIKNNLIRKDDDK